MICMADTYYPPRCFLPLTDPSGLTAAVSSKTSKTMFPTVCPLKCVDNSFYISNLQANIEYLQMDDSVPAVLLSFLPRVSLKYM